MTLEDYVWVTVHAVSTILCAIAVVMVDVPVLSVAFFLLGLLLVVHMDAGLCGKEDV
jgi:hypothetical protein